MKVKKLSVNESSESNVKKSFDIQEQIDLKEDFNSIVDAKWDEKNHCYILPIEELEDWE